MYRGTVLERQNFWGRLSGEGKCPLTVKIAVAAENGDVVGVM